MAGLAKFSENNADTLWFSLNFILLVSCFWLLGKIVFRETLPFKQRLAVYFFTFLGISRFIFINFDTGQTNILVMASIISGIYFIQKNKPIPAGALLGFSAMIKYTPLIFIPYFFFRRKFRLLAIMLISIFVYLWLPSLAIGLKQNFYYLKGLPVFLRQSTIFDQMTILDPKNQSLLSMWQRFFTSCVAYFHAPAMPFERLNASPMTIQLVYLFSALGLYAAALVKSRREDHPLEDYCLLAICVALFNLNAWVHNYILLALPYFVILYYLVKRGFRDRVVAILLVISFMLNFVTAGAFWSEKTAYKLYFYSPFALSALAAFLALIKVKFLPKPQI
ncbi:MAG: glycosyltransferase family 87 protein [Candidatus Omnitrophota bacterium]